MKRAIIMFVALALSGCALRPAVEQKVVTAEVKVREPCIKRAPDRPAYRTGKGAYPGEKAAAKILADDFEQAERYGTAWEAAAAGCIMAPPAAR